MRVVEGEAARVEVDRQQQQARLDAQHAQRRQPVWQDAVALERIPQCVPDGDRVRGLDPDLVAEVAGVAGPRDRHRPRADGARGDAEERQPCDRRNEPAEQVARAWALDGEGPDIQAHVLDAHAQAPDSIGQVRVVRLRRGEQVVVPPATLDHAILEHEAALVEPGRVLRSLRRAGANVAGQDAGEEAFCVRPRDPVLEERRGVEDARRVADREVLELVRDLVAVGRQVPRPVVPQAGLVERAEAVVEGRRVDHRC